VSHAKLCLAPSKTRGDHETGRCILDPDDQSLEVRSKPQNTGQRMLCLSLVASNPLVFCFVLSISEHLESTKPPLYTFLVTHGYNRLLLSFRIVTRRSPGYATAVLAQARQPRVFAKFEAWLRCFPIRFGLVKLCSTPASTANVAHARDGP